MKIFLIVLWAGLVASCAPSIDFTAQNPDFQINPAVGLFDASRVYSRVRKNEARREKFCKPNKKFLALADTAIPKPERSWVGKKVKRVNIYAEYRKKGIPFARAVAAKTDNYLHRGDTKSARRAVELLLNWADTNELYVKRIMDVGSRGGARGASAALDYILPAWHVLKYSNQASTSDINKIERWLDGVVNSTKKARGGMGPQLQVASARHYTYFGIITQNTAYINYGINIYVKQLRNIRQDGSITDASRRGRVALKFTKNRIIPLMEIAVLAENTNIELVSMKNKSGVGLLDAVNFFEQTFADNRLIDQYAIKNVKPPQKFKDFQQNAQVIRQRDLLQVKLTKALLLREGDPVDKVKIFSTANLQCNS